MKVLVDMKINNTIGYCGTPQQYEKKVLILTNLLRFADRVHQYVVLLSADICILFSFFTPHYCHLIV